MAGPFQGIKIVELGHWVAIPSACAIFADWGADVVKIEDPGRGDAIRGVRSLEGTATSERGVQCLFEFLNRNKRSIAIDLRNKQSSQIVHKLVQGADIFATNFQTGVLKKLGMDYASLKKTNPRIIYASLTGYGRVGKDKERPGFDYSAFWARSGIQSKLAWRGQTPVPARPGIGDNITSMMITGGISAALFAREKTGIGQEVSFSLYRTGVWALGLDNQMSLFRNVEIPNYARESMANPLWNVYKVKDGDWIQLVMVQSDPFWPAFCKAMGIEHLEKDPLYESSLQREKNSKPLIVLISDIFLTKSLNEWEKIFDENSLICGRVLSPMNVAHDPQAYENNFFTEINHPVCGPMKYIASPVDFSDTPASIKAPAPEVGQHTEEILLELGYQWEDIANFKEQGAIG